jgi:hypothetical protein
MRQLLNHGAVRNQFLGKALRMANSVARHRLVADWRLGLADGERKYDDLEKRLAALPVVTVPAITMEGDSNGASRLFRLPP